MKKGHFIQVVALVCMSAFAVMLGCSAEDIEDEICDVDCASVTESYYGSTVYGLIDGQTPMHIILEAIPESGGSVSEVYEITFDESNIDASNNVYFNPDTDDTLGNAIFSGYDDPEPEKVFLSEYPCSDARIELQSNWNVAGVRLISGVIKGELFGGQTLECRQYNVPFSAGGASGQTP